MFVTDVVEYSNEISLIQMICAFERYLKDFFIEHYSKVPINTIKGKLEIDLEEIFSQKTDKLLK